MIERAISQEIIQKATLESREMGELKNSITKGEGNIYGFVGELVVSNYIGAVISRTYDYDLVKNNLRIDVKTKHCTSKPKLNYLCSIAAYNIKQECDYYVFVRVMKDLTKAWVLGCMEKEEFFKRAKFYKKGEIDPSSIFGWTFKADCYNMAIQDLKDVKII